MHTAPDYTILLSLFRDDCVALRTLLTPKRSAGFQSPAA